MKFAKKRTLADIVMGPFTPKDGVDLDGVNLDVKLSRCAGNFIDRTDKTPTKHLGDGYFKVVLSGHKDTEYTGHLLVVASGKDVNETLDAEVCVLNGNVYESIFGSSMLRVDVEAMFGIKPGK